MKSTNLQSLTTDFFEALYRENPDPWQFATSEYEAKKYATTLNSLPRDRYQSAFEIGGSIGIFTEQLASKCESLLSVDVSTIAQEQAKHRCQHLSHVDFQIMSVPDEFPDTSFDLIVLSEVGYYWCWDDFYKAQNLMLDRLKPQGHLEIVHWIVDARVLPLTGDLVHDSFLELVPNRLAHLHSLTTDKYRLDLFEKL
ncbi:SAM-dependent methyltransferase [Chamaesiphon minutus]|uniref:Nodulation protein S (NodS) n=1 Tax=Chamaesiphon minutus (strain ATCC 27169 / PCC 6605) TaxID=1173020 RepID=K9UJT4_CHAP6|nr:SAM-dependent methyltransferase [Chamaesiphon minutus]AFY95342.1 Nodulation protein S (NodS) [Chamaesiphon minutus PCC 6605]